MKLTQLLLLIIVINHSYGWYSEEEKQDKEKGHNESDAKSKYLKYKKHYKKYKYKKYRDDEDTFDSRDDGNTDTSSENEEDNSYWDEYLRNDEENKDKCNCTCTPTDCRVTAWSKWSEPRGLKGTRERKRHVLIKPTNNGKPCPRLREARVTGVDPTIDQTARSFYKNFILHNSDDFDDETLYDDEYHKKKAIVPRDLLFILDESGSIGRSQFRKVRAGVARLIELLCGKVGPDEMKHHRYAVTTFGSKPSVQKRFNFKRYQTKAGYRYGIRNVSQRGGSTCTGNALKHAYEVMFTPVEGARLHQPKVRKEVLLLTDGKSNCGHDIEKEAAKLRTIATVYTVGIGEFNNKYARAELENTVSAPNYNHVFSVPDERGFLEMLHRVETRLNETWAEYGDACATMEWD